jgi:hypothetical protein
VTSPANAGKSCYTNLHFIINIIILLCVFQELCEFAQRKFLRQLLVYAEVQDMLPYPRLFLVDFAKKADTGRDPLEC